MTDQVDILYHAMRFTPILGVLDLLLAVHFFASWYRSARKTGWKLDFWYLSLSLNFFPSLNLLYPFSASLYNFPTTMGGIEKISPFVDTAFLISVLGYLFMWIGRFSFDRFRERSPLGILILFARPFSHMVERNIKSVTCFRLLSVGTLLLGACILAIQFSQGYFFNGRKFFMGSPEFRPLFNITISIFPIALTYFALRFTQYKEKKGLWVYCILLIFSLFFWRAGSAALWPSLSLHATSFLSRRAG